MEKNDPIPVSVGILTYNSGERLERCLKSLEGFGEIIIADGGSTDTTLDIAKKYGCTIISQSQPGRPIEDFAKERQRMLDTARYEWFFYLDSDEIISSELKESIAKIARNDHPAHFVYKVRYMITSPDFSNKYQSFKPYYQNRFFNKRSGAYFIKKVHEKITFPKNISVGTIDDAWYVPLDDQLDFKVYKRKVEFRLGLMAAEWKSKNVVTFIIKGIFPQIMTMLKQFYKAIYMFFKYRSAERVPFKYEMYRLYSSLVLMRKLTVRFISLYKKSA